VALRILSIPAAISDEVPQKADDDDLLLPPLPFGLVGGLVVVVVGLGGGRLVIVSFKKVSANARSVRDTSELIGSLSRSISDLCRPESRVRV